MDSQSIKELEILHEISKSERVNQRYLGEKLGMAPGLVNLYLKRLAHKAYIKIGGIKPRRLKYLITPRGLSEKTRLTYEFALISYKYLKNATDDIKKRLSEMENADQTSVVVYGAGELVELCLLLIKEFNIQVVAVVDDPAKGNRFHGYQAVPKDLLRSLKFDKLIIAEISGKEKARALVSELGIEADKVCWLLDASVDRKVG